MKLSNSKHFSPNHTSRREFLSQFLPAGTLFCMGGCNVLALSDGDKIPEIQEQEHKFLKNSGMTYKRVFEFALNSYYIPVLNRLAKEIGREKFLSMLTKANAEVYSQMLEAIVKNYPDRSMKTLASIFKNMLSTPPLDKALQYEIVENTDKVFEMKFTECLPARICREMNAADIGYALECAPTDAVAKSINPKMRAENPKNLMKGDSVCIERFVLEI